MIKFALENDLLDEGTPHRQWRNQWSGGRVKLLPSKGEQKMEKEKGEKAEETEARGRRSEKRKKVKEKRKEE